MDKNSEYWKVQLTPKHKEQLDLDLIDELNQDMDLFDDEVESAKAKKPIVVRLIGFLTALAFLLIVLGGYLKVFTLPPLDFLAKSRELAKISQVHELREAVVTVKALNRQGTGFNIDSQGLIVTNYHVVRDARLVFVGFADGTIHGVKEAIHFPEVDLALLDIAGDNLPVLALENENNMKTGDKVIVIGNPLGFPQVVKEGEVVGQIRLQGWEDPVIMIKGPIYSGSSGSPVFNEEGTVVAVVFGTLKQQANSEQVENIGLAVPINQLKARFHRQ